MIDALKAKYPLEGAEWGESSIKDDIVIIMAKWWVGDNKFGQEYRLFSPVSDATFKRVRDGVQRSVDRHKEAA